VYHNLIDVFSAHRISLQFKIILYNLMNMKTPELLNEKLRIILCLLSAVLLALSFPRTSLWPLAWVSLFGFFVAIEGRDFLDSFRYGFVFGWIFFFITQYWINNSISRYGGMPLIASLAVVALLCAYESIYIALFAGFSSFALKRGHSVDIIFISALWVALEYLRGLLFTGFPWSLLGYSQTNILPLMQVVDITGIFGVSFLIVLGNLIIYVSITKGFTLKKLFLPILIIFVALVYGSVRYYSINSKKPSKTIKIAVVQPNIDQSKKWNKEYKEKNLELLFRLTDNLLQKKPELVIWPETALPFYYGLESFWSKKLNDFIKNKKIILLTGAAVVRDIKKVNGYYKYILSNSAILFYTNGNLMGSYDKIHLVPFGEYVPLKKILFFVKRLVEGIGDFKRGDKYTIFEINGKRFFVIICYEVIFPSLVSSFEDVDFIVNITNDAWFGSSSGPYQHAEIARVRAIEMRRPLIRVANSGISEVVDITGRILTKTKLNERAIEVVKVPLRDSEESIYKKIGDLFSYIMLLISAIKILNDIRTSKSIGGV